MGARNDKTEKQNIQFYKLILPKNIKVRDI